MGPAAGDAYAANYVPLNRIFHISNSLSSRFSMSRLTTWSRVERVHRFRAISNPTRLRGQSRSEGRRIMSLDLDTHEAHRPQRTPKLPPLLRDDLEYVRGNPEISRQAPVAYT